MQRRCYWLLSSENDFIVLVHYLNTKQSKPMQQMASWAPPRQADPVTGQLPTTPRPHNAALSFSEASASSFSAAAGSSFVESASGSFTVTTGHMPRPVAEFRLGSKDCNPFGRRLSSVGAISSMPPGLGAGPGPGPFVKPQATMPHSPFLASAPVREDHGFDDAVLRLNRGGALPQEDALPPPAAREAEEHRASALVSSFASRRSVQGNPNKTTAFVPYASSTPAGEVGRRTSQPAVSAFE